MMNLPVRARLFAAALLLACAQAHAASFDPRLKLTRARSSGGFSVQGGGGAGTSTEKISLFLRLKPGVSRDAVAARYPDALLGPLSHGVMTARMPVSRLAQLSADSEVDYAKEGVRYQAALDVARSTAMSGANILGSLSPAAANFNDNFGQNVVIGIIDSGIDWNHNDFRNDANPALSRILAFWDQVYSGGTPPSAPFNYGSEWTQAQIENEIDGTPAGVVVSSDTDGHGTHVAGIFGGDGSDSDPDAPAGTFRGIASSATIVAVKTTFLNPDILAGVNYIISKAAGVGKRAVINLSLSAQTGPHDGTGVFESALNTIAASTPVVVSLGNFGGLNSHASSVVSLGGTRRFDIQRFAATTILDFDFWGVAGDTYTVVITTAVTGGTQVTAGPDQSNSVTIAGTTIDVDNFSVSAENGDPNVFIRITGSPVSHTNFYVTFQRAGFSTGSGVVDGWAFDTAFSQFTSFTDSSKTLGSPADTPNAISVTSYCHKRQWRDNSGTLQTDADCTAGTLGDVSSFSSQGPNRGGAAKPEIAAPGDRTASTLSTDMDFPPGASDILQGGRHRMLAGTSMAAPVVAGAVALKINETPGITVAQIRSQLALQASTDTKTGTVPSANTWGAGKLRLFGCGAAVTAGPASVTPSVFGVSSISWTWALAANATSYHLYYATGGYIADMAAPPLLLTGLSANSTYQLQVRGANACGEGPGTNSASTSTLSVPLGGSTLAAFASSITVTYTALPPSPRPSSSFGYLLQASTASNFSGTLFSSATNQSSQASLSVVGLTAFSTYYLRLGTLNEPGAAQFISAGSTLTPTSLVAPAFSSFSLETSTQIRVNWSLGGNPAGLQYIAVVSTAANFTGTTDQSSTTRNLFALFSGLAVNTTHYFQVRATTGPWASFPSTSTAAGAPVTPSFPGVFLTSMSAQWLSGGNPAGTRYWVDVSSVSSFTAGVISSNTANTNLTVTGLDKNTTHYLRVIALGNNGGASTALQASTATLSDPPGAAAPAFLLVRSSITAQWTPLPSSPQNASCEGYRLEASLNAGFTGALRTATTNDPAASQLTVTGLFGETTYYLRVAALNWNSVPSYLALGSTTTPEVVNSTGLASSNAPLVLSVVPPFPELTRVTVEIPPGALPHGIQVELNASVPFAFDPSQVNQASMTPVGGGVGVDITAQGAQPVLPVRVRMEYDPALFPPGADPSRIIMANFHSGVWTLLPTVVNTPNRLIIAETTHFSLFAPFFVGAGSALDSVHIFPRPWKPRSGDAQFDALALTFSNLPSDGKVVLYTIMGEKVWEASAPGTGVLQWDGRNNSGRTVASGTYLAVITGSGSRRIERVVVIR